MKILRFSVIATFAAALVLIIYRNWFFKGLLTAPDFSFIYPMQSADFQWFPFAWSNTFGNGLGGSTFNTLNLDTYLHMGIRFLLYTLHIPWNLTYRILFFWPFLAISIVSGYMLCFTLFKKRSVSVIGSLIYTTNTYALMLTGGGQVGLMMAYAVSPLVLYGLINSSPRLFALAVFGLLLFDLRYSFLIGATIILYGLFIIPRTKWIATIQANIKPFVIILGLHSFWLIPALFSRGLTLPEGYGSLGWLEFLSWAEFSKAISLLHPNWPENIFGKTYFMRPEFMIIPILAYASLLLVNRFSSDLIKKQIHFFAALALIAAFFAKGINPPFPQINTWFFENAPFFNGFRDPTKFYLLISLSYAVLIPSTLLLLSDLIQKYFQERWRVFVSLSLLISFIVFWGMTLYPIFGQVRPGTFSITSVPDEYRRFSDMVYENKKFGRTMVFPWKNRFVFQSENHPVVDAREVFGTSDIPELAELILQSDLETILRKHAVKYVVVPDDFTDEIFLTNRERDAALRESIIKSLDATGLLKRLKIFDNLIVYESTIESGGFYTVHNKHAYELFTGHQVSPVYYKVDITASQRPLGVYFSQKYDQSWQLWDGEKIIPSSPSAEGLNTFILDSDITSQVVIYNTNQRLMEIGYLCSGLALLAVIIWCWYLLSRRLRLKKKVAIFFSVILIILFVSLLPRATVLNIFVPTYVQLQTEFDKYRDEILDKFLSHEGIQFFTRSAHCSYGTAGFALNTLFSNICPGERYYGAIANHRCWRGIWSCHLMFGRIDRYLSSRGGGALGVFGDSISVIYGGLNYTQLLSEWVGYDLHNSSILGSTVSVVPMRDSALSRYRSALSAHNPNVIIVFLGTNDLSYSVPIGTFSENYTALISGIKKYAPQSKIVTVGLLKRNDMDRGRITLYSDAIRKVARESGAVFLDPYHWLSYGDIPDGIHPSIESQSVLADRLYHFIR